MFRFLLATSIATAILACNPNRQENISATEGESSNELIISSDINNFWDAYDAIVATTDTLEKRIILKERFWDKATFGQQELFRVRNYKQEEYLQAIKDYPLFWSSIRMNMKDMQKHEKPIAEGISKIKKIYPSIKPAKVYLGMGVFRTPGTGFDSLVLIGSEYALGNKNTNTSEFEKQRSDYFLTDPIKNLEFLSVHEYVHTQQKPMLHNLLSLVLYEGIAEFVAEIATEKKSPWKSFSYGPENQEFVLKRFEEDIFKPSTIGNWLWNSRNNEFGTDNLGYYIGHTIASKYYEKASDKKAAIKTLIELDFTDEDLVEEIVDTTKFLTDGLENLYVKFESQRPSIIRIDPFENNSESVDPSTKEMTFHFSEPLNGHNTGIDYGPLGEEVFPEIDFDRKWSNDNRSWTIKLKLESNKKYQFLVSNNFRKKNGIPLKPLLVNFKTK